MSSRLSFGMTPKTVRLPKNGEMLLSVRGSPLGVYQEENLASISTIHGNFSNFDIFVCLILKLEMFSLSHTHCYDLFVSISESVDGSPSCGS